MRKSRHSFLTVLVLLLVSIVCFYNAHRIIADADENPSALSEATEERIELYYAVDEVSEINVGQTSRNIKLIASENDEIKISFMQDDDSWNEVLVELTGGVLSVKQPNGFTVGNFRWGITFPQISWDDNGFDINWDNDGEYDVLITLPRSYSESLKISTISGDIEVLDGYILSAVELKTTSGDISSFGITVPAFECSSVSGEIKTEGLAADNATIRTTSGEIDVQGNIKDTLTYSTVSGDVEIIGDIRRIDGKTTSGDSSLTSGTEIIEATMSSVSGEINLEIPNKNPVVSFSSISGDLRGNLGVISGGSGTPVISVRTTSGDLIIDGR